MDRKAHIAIDRLRSKRARLKDKKGYVLSKIRKYSVEIQRAVIKNIRRELMDIERQIDSIMLGSANTPIMADACGLISRSFPIGARYEIETNPEIESPDSFGFWRADNSSLIMAFGALRADMESYIDDLALPGLFAGPFTYKDQDGRETRYMILLDEASAWFEGSGSMRLLTDIIMPAGRLLLRRDTRYKNGTEEARYIKNKDSIETAVNAMIDIRRKLGDMTQDAAGAYLTYRKAYAEYICEKSGTGFDEKDMATIRRLRRRFGLNDKERIG